MIEGRLRVDLDVRMNLVGGEASPQAKLGWDCTRHSLMSFYFIQINIILQLYLFSFIHNY